MINLEDFKLKCKEGICLRNTIQSKGCSLDAKRDRCYLKYKKQYEKKIEKVIEQKDEVWETVKLIVTKRDVSCRLWACLSMTDREFILKNYVQDYNTLFSLDVAHIKGRGSHSDKKYDPENCVLIRRYFHGLLDGFKHPVTRENITEKERDNWFLKISTRGGKI